MKFEVQSLYEKKSQMYFLFLPRHAAYSTHLPNKIIHEKTEGNSAVYTTSAVRALVISPCTWMTPSIGAIGCKSIATIRGRFSSLHTWRSKKLMILIETER